MIARLMKREPQRTDADWNERTYPCRRWYCFRRSPSWRSFERGGKSWCDRHCPPEHVVVSIAAELVFELEAAEARVAALEEATEAVVAQGEA